MDFQDGIIQEEPKNQNLKYAVGLLRRWPIILATLIISLLLAFSYNRYATPIYLVQARISTTKFTSQPYNPVPGLVDASFFLKGYTDVFEEIPTLMSRERIEKAVD